MREIAERMRVRTGQDEKKEELRVGDREVTAVERSEANRTEEKIEEERNKYK